MAIVVVNSTLGVRLSMANDGRVSPIHYWGYPPGPEDMLLSHRLNRYEIAFRHRFCGGTDPRVLLQTLHQLKRGALGVYCVTQPDLMKGIPLVKRLFPKRRFVTWIWTPREALENARYLRYADHVFSLTEPGLDALRTLGMDGRCSLGLWGCDPSFYRCEEPECPIHEEEVLFFGLVSRDITLIRRLAATGEFRIATTKRSISVLGSDLGLREIDIDSKAGLIRAIQSARVTLVPLKCGDSEPTGFTNVVESLLCGTSVVIANCSIIPSVVLSLPGVHRYETGDWDSFIAKICQALRESEQPGKRYEIRHAASAVLNGRNLNAEIRRMMGLSMLSDPAVR